MLPHIMLDSGAFSVFTRGEEIKLDDYIHFLHTFLADYPHVVYVNLDVIGDGKKSFENWKEMKRQGLDPLPIHTIWSEDRWLVNYLSETDRIGIGGMVVKSSAKKLPPILRRLWGRFLTNEEGLPIARVHGMGLTSFRMMKDYPWHSVDSTNYTKKGRFGYIFVPKKKNGRWDFTQRPHLIGISTQCGDRRNKGKHFDNLPRIEKRAVVEWITELGYELGVSRFVSPDGHKRRKRNNKDKLAPVEEVVVKGVKTHHVFRKEICAEFFFRYLAEIPWPRPYVAPMRGGLMPDQENRPVFTADPPAEDPERKHTLLYLSGDEAVIPWLNSGAGNRHRDYGGLLFSYADIRSPTNQLREKLVSLLEEYNNEGQPERTPTSTQRRPRRNDSEGTGRAKQRIRIRRRRTD